jgi:hypothetical protein
MPLAEVCHSRDVERISECMREHNGLGLTLTKRLLQISDVRVACDRIIIEKDWDGAVLNDRSDGRGKPGGAGDHLVPW